MKLGGIEVLLLQCCTERFHIVAQGRGVFARFGIIRMYEVNILVFHCGSENSPFQMINGVPPHMGHLVDMFATRGRHELMHNLPEDAQAGVSPSSEWAHIS